MLRLVLVSTMIVSVSSCEKDSAAKADAALSKRCAKALSKVGLDELMLAATPGQGKPSPEEQAIIDVVRKNSQAVCEAEGLTIAQAACFDPIVDIETLFLSADCPAIVAEQPSWLRVPPPEIRKQALEQMKQRDGLK